MDERAPFEATVVESARQHWWLIVIGAAAGLLAAFLLGSLVVNGSKAVATVLIEDPRSSQVFDSGSVTQPERYLASQVAILESPALARTVASSRSELGLDFRDVMGARTIVASPTSDLIAIEVVHGTDDGAISLANAFGEAYGDYRDDVTAAAFEDAISGLDNSIRSIDEELASIDEDIEELIALPVEGDLTTNLEEATQALLQSLSNPGDPQAVEVLLNQLQTLQVIRSLITENPNLNLLVETRRDVVNRRTQLVVRRDQLSVDAAMTSTGIVVFSEATEAEPAVPIARLAVLMGLIGAVAGLAIAYAKAVRDARFSHQSEPEAVLNVPLLAEIPIFNQVGTMDALPVLTNPESPEAEAFRFAGSAIVARLGQMEARSGIETRSVTITSAVVGDGKTIVTINAALSVATRGKRVLIIDGDFGDPSLTRLLVGLGEGIHGMTDVVEGDALLSDVVIPVNLSNRYKVDVLTRGTAEISAGDFFASRVTHELFEVFKTRYDYIFVDAPPFLQVSYATALAGLTDAVVAVVPHNAKVALAQELLRRVELVGARFVGYVYNKAPRRPELLERRGSTIDLLGRGASLSNRD